VNILFHCWEYPPRGSGIGRYIFHMSKAFRETGHFTVVVTSHGDEGPSEEQVENGIIYYAYSIKDIGKPHIAELILQKAREHHVEWIEGAEHLGESALLLNRRPRPPVVIKAHYNDVLKCARYAQAHYPWQKLLIDLACWRDRERLKRERDSLENAEVLTAASARVLQEIEVEGLRLPVRRYVVPNPITLLPEWINQEALEPTILLIGRIDIGKGIEYLPRLLDALVPQFKNLLLEIVGGDSYARFIGSTKRWLLRKLGERSRYVNFLGTISPAALDEAYRRAWVVIVPSRWDTFPTVVLEAMVRSKAIVASPHGGMPEMLSETDCVVADPEKPQFSQAVAALLADPGQRKRAGASALKKALHTYNSRKIVSDYVAILNSVL
jgi:glycosyltransferase involved in cell wall biosynthesis